MPGTRIFSKTSRIFNFIAVILPLPILLISFLIGRVIVSASSAYDYNTEEITVTDGGITYSGRLTPSAIIDDNGEVIYENAYWLDELPPPPDFSAKPAKIFVRYDGVISVSHTYTFSPSDAGVYRDGYICGVVSDSIQLNFANGLTGYNATPAIMDHVKVNNLETSCSYGLNNNPRFTGLNNNAFTVYDISEFESEFIALGTIRHNYNINCSVTIRCDSLFNDYFNCWSQLANSYFSPSVTVGYTSCVLYGSPYNFREMIEHLDTKLYNSWVTENLIYSVLTDIYNKDSDILTAINNLKSSLEADDTRLLQAIVALQSQMHSDNLTEQDILQNDHSGWSDDMYDWRDEFEAIQASADSAVDSAYLDYTNDLASVNSANWHDVLSGQSREANFWRTLGEYILNPSNLGYVAGGLLVVSLLSLFVFLLRL